MCPCLLRSRQLLLGVILGLPRVFCVESSYCLVSSKVSMSSVSLRV